VFVVLAHIKLNYCNSLVNSSSVADCRYAIWVWMCRRQNWKEKKI